MCKYFCKYIMCKCFCKYLMCVTFGGRQSTSRYLRPLFQRPSLLFLSPFCSAEPLMEISDEVTPASDFHFSPSSDFPPSDLRWGRKSESGNLCWFGGKVKVVRKVKVEIPNEREKVRTGQLENSEHLWLWQCLYAKRHATYFSVSSR